MLHDEVLHVATYSPVVSMSIWKNCFLVHKESPY